MKAERTIIVILAILTVLATIANGQHFGPGICELEQPVVLPWGSGGSVSGEGRNLVTLKPRDQFGTTLVAPEGKPAVIMRGQMQEVRDLTLQGGGVVVERTGGLGEGKHEFARICVDRAPVAFDVGKLGDNNCDNMWFSAITAYRCGTMFRVNNDQGMGYTWESFLFSGGEYVFDFPQGGDLWVLSGKVTGPTKALLRTGAHGWNNNKFVLSHIKCDTQCGPMCLLQATTDSPVFATLDSIHVAYDHYERDNARMVLARGNSVISIRGCNLQRRTIEWHARRRRDRTDTPNILIDRCVLSGDALSVLEMHASQGPLYFRVTNCTRFDGTPVEDWPPAGTSTRIVVPW